jgi:hypothetical protein
VTGVKRSRAHSIRLALAIVALAVACSSGRRGAAAGGESTVITAEEIARVRVANAYDAILRLRPAFFRERGRTSLIGRDQRSPVLYVDDQRIGDLGRLRDIDATTVWQIRYLSATESQQRWGNGHGAGVIQVLTLRSRSGT